MLARYKQGRYDKVMQRYYTWPLSIAKTPAKMLWVIIFITLITHLPTGFGSFVADDYLQWAMLEGSPVLHDLGFAKADPHKTLADSLQDSFHFFNETAGTLEHYQRYGNVFWWSGTDISMAPFRPVAALTHWLDYRLFDQRLWLHQLHSLMYFLLLSALLYKLYRCIPLRQGIETADARQNTLVIAALATILFIVDFSFTRSFAWVAARNSYMACAIGIASVLLFIRWRQEGNLKWLLASMTLFAFALLTAEAAISAAAYMGAYVLCIERQSLMRKALPLIPIITTIVIWRVYYSSNGFGSLNIGQYIDPGRSPVEFATNLISVFPLIAFSQITGIDTLIIYFHPDKQLGLIVVAWIVTLTGFACIWRFLRRNEIDRFWFVGSVVAAIPGSALISAESRTVSFVAIGFFYLLAKLLLHWHHHNKQWQQRWLFRFVFTWHCILPAILAILLTSNLTGFSQLSNQHESIQSHITPGDTALVVIVPQTSGTQYYLPFEWAFRGIPVPGSINILSTGLESVTLTRLTEREFVLTAPAGMPLNHRAPVQPLNRPAPAIHPMYATLYTQSFFTLPDRTFDIGYSVVNADIRYTVLDRNHVGPTKVKLEFIGDQHPDSMVWQRYDFKNHQYEIVDPIAINDTLSFAGALD